MFQFEILKPFADRLKHGLLKNAYSMKGTVRANQQHGEVIMDVMARPDKTPRCDAFITHTKALPLMVKAADCQGILIYDPKTHTAAAVHSGWRGSALNILGKTLDRMSNMYGSVPADLFVAVSPSLGPCCAEFSDPYNELPEFCRPFVGHENHVDFWALTVQQGTQAGVPPDHIEVAGICTKCRSGYPSHRNGDSGRMGVFVILL